jgi:hypothetical protein
VACANVTDCRVGAALAFLQGKNRSVGYGRRLSASGNQRKFVAQTVWGQGVTGA